MESRSLVREINRINRLHAENDSKVKNTKRTSTQTRNPQGARNKAYRMDTAGSVGYRPRTSAAAKKKTDKRPNGRSAYSDPSLANASRIKRRASRRRELAMYLTVAGSVIVVAAVIALIIIFYNLSFTKIALSDYAVVDFSGYDSKGTAEVHMDVGPGSDEFWENISLDLDRSADLKNGDDVTVTFGFDEDMAKESKLKVDGSRMTVTVTGLTPQTLIDSEKLFSGMQVTQNGLSPKVAITVENVSDDTFVSQVAYTAETEKTFFADGDEVIIRADIPEEILNSDEYDFELGDEGTGYVYTISEADCYVTDPEDISEGVLKQLEDEGMRILLDSDANEYGLRIFQQEAHIKAVFVGNRTTFKWDGAYVISSYFHSVTEEGIQAIENHTNDVQIVYGVTITQQDGSKAFVEAVVQFTNIIRRADGIIDLSESPGRLVSCTYRDKNVKSLVAGINDSNYHTTKLAG